VRALGGLDVVSGLTAPLRDLCPVLVIEEEHPLQIRPRQRPREPPVRSSLIIGQELHRHARKVGQPTDGSPTAIKPLQDPHLFDAPPGSERRVAVTRAPTPR